MEEAAWDVKAQFATYKKKDVFDCLIAEFLLSDGTYLPTLLLTLEKYKVTSLEDLAAKQKEQLAKYQKIKALFYDIELPLASVLWKMEQIGITLDTKKLTSVGKEIEKEIVTLEDVIKNHIGFDINLNSPVQVGNYLVEKEGVALPKTKTGKYATGESELSKFKDQYPIIKQVLSYRELAKLRSTYVDSLISKVDKNSRLHTTYHQVSVSTGRLASSNPNLQNIPVASTFGQKIKSCFITSKGYSLASFDYSQQELRILAHLTGEEKLIDAFRTNRDVHKITASQLFSVKYDKVTPKQRSVGKTINFGIIYGMSSYGLSEGINISVEEAQMFIDTFYTTYPKIKTFYDDFLEKGKINGYVETILGRRRSVFLYPGPPFSKASEGQKQKFIDNATRRVLLNYPIQGAAADFMKMAMVKIDNEILQKEKDVRLLLQIHDDLVFEIKDNDPIKFGNIINRIKDIMSNVYPLSVPVEVDVKVGKSWGKMEKYQKNA